MILNVRIVLAVVCLASCIANADAELLSPQGYGPIQFGMKIEAAEAAVKQSVTGKYSRSGCDYVQFKQYPNLRFMIEDGVVTRADAKKGVKNSANIQAGMSLKQVKKMYPQAVIEPHKYDDEGHYVILSAPGNRAIVLEESKGKITDIRAGLKPSVEYVEGCL